MRSLIVGLVSIALVVCSCVPVKSTQVGKRTLLGSELRYKQIKVDPGFLAEGEAAGDGSIAFRLTASCTESGIRYERYRARYKYKRGPNKDSDLAGSIPGGLFTLVGGFGTFAAFGLDDNTPGVIQVLMPVMLVAGLSALWFGPIRPRLNRKTWYTKETFTAYKGQASQKVTCPATARTATLAQVQIRTPWGQSATVPVLNGRASFKPNWSTTGIAPHAQASRARLQNGWTLSAGGHTVAWQPRGIDIDMMLKSIARATGDDVKVVKGGAPPLLEVAGLQGSIVAGVPSSLQLTIRNDGSGSAYRVVVETRSGEPSMHRVRFVFGSIGPGKSVTRTATVNVPVTHKGGSAVLVLRFSEANNNVPGPATKRINIIAGKVAALQLSCAIAKGATGSGANWIADAGASLLVRCTLRNAGRATAKKATFSATLSGSSRRAPARNLRPNGKASAGLLLRVPANGTTGQRYNLVISATENSVARSSARQTLVIEVGQQSICRPPISRAEYNRKLNKLKGDRRQGLIDKATFERFEAQLVGCLQ